MMRSVLSSNSMLGSEIQAASCECRTGERFVSERGCMFSSEVHQVSARPQLAAALYALAKDFTEAHFRDEIVWQRAVTIDEINESDFLRESAWVVLCSGFRARTLRSHFGYLSLCFCDWESGAVIAANADVCRASALAAFNSPRKIDALIRIAERIATEGFASFMHTVELKPIQALQTLPFIGPITAYHLAKNIGLPVAKPDRHLQRLAAKLAYPSVHDLCGEIAELTGDPPHVVDLIFWHYLAEGNQHF